MIEISIKHNLKDAISHLDRYQRQFIPQATVSALNKVAVKAQGQSVKAVAELTGLKQKTIREKLQLVRAYRDRLQAVIRVHPKGINLIEFVAPNKRNPQAFRKQNKRGEFKQRGVTAKAWGRPGKVYRGTFIGHGKDSGKALVFTRTGPSRHSKLKAIHGPSIPLGFANKTVQRIMRETVEAEFGKLFEHEIKWRTDRSRMGT